MKPKSGQILIIMVIFLIVITILSASLFSNITNFLGFGANSIMKEQAVNLAEAAIDKALWELNESRGTYSGETSTPIGSTGTIDVQIEHISAFHKIITATGFIPSSTSPRAKRTIRVEAQSQGETIAFEFAVQTPEGNVTMANSSRIGGTVYSNGNIVGSGNAIIDGDAYAVGTISSPAPTVTGNKFPGSPPADLPSMDYDFWRNAAASGDTTTCSPTCQINGGTASIGPQKYDGDLQISNNATVTVNGPIWITGNLQISQGQTAVNLNPSFGSFGTVIMVDGTISITQGADINPTPADPPGYLLVASDSTSPTALTIGNSAANAVFFSLTGGAQISQKVDVVALISNSLTMTQNSELIYNLTLSSGEFTAGPEGIWGIRKGTYHFK